jgi:hypothetical protein
MYAGRNGPPTRTRQVVWSLLGNSIRGALTLGVQNAHACKKLGERLFSGAKSKNDGAIDGCSAREIGIELFPASQSSWQGTVLFQVVSSRKSTDFALEKPFVPRYA